MNTKTNGGSAIDVVNERSRREQAAQERRRNDTPMELAMAAAREYRTMAAREGHNHAGCLQLEEDIRGWVGFERNGKIVIPDALWIEMGFRK